MIQNKIDSDAVKELSYFELLAVLGNVSLHCGGPEASYRLLDLAGANSSSTILEIGCGPGVTSTALLNNGIDLTVVEKSPLMLKAALNRCAKLSKRLPKYFEGGIEDAESFLKNKKFDIVLLECVFGFVEKKHKAIEIIKSCLRDEGSIALIDFSYLTPPPHSIRADLANIGINEVLYKADWERYFEDFHLSRWDIIGMSLTPSSLDSIEQALKESAFFIEPGAISQIAEEMYGRLLEYEKLFSINKKCMSAHAAIWNWKKS
jgi:SAM-dependent methyltransferase